MQMNLLANGQWRNRYDNEICNLYKEIELTGYIKMSRIQRWATC
jgi:hypothetical protein